MGCTNSKQLDNDNIIQSKQLASTNDNNNTAEKDKISKQRRKLSVAPQHVGDINGNNNTNNSLINNNNNNINQQQQLQTSVIANTNNTSKPLRGTRKGSIIQTGDTTLYNNTNNNNDYNQLQQQPIQYLDADELAYTGSNLTEQDIISQQKHNILHGTRSRKGVVPYNKNKVNQDRAFIKYAMGPNNNIICFGVCDGHGEFGHLVASFVQLHLPQSLNDQNDLLYNDTTQAIYNAIDTVVHKLHDSNINAAFSGTTCVFGLLVNNTLYIGNIGDSRCILAKRGNNSENNIVAVPLTQDQKPEVPSERQRIINAGGRVEPLPGPPGEDCGPPRVWLAEVDVPGLAMSRSIGDDVSQTVGVISTPEITKYTLSNNDLYIILASDGVWEFLDNQVVVDIINDKLYYNNHQNHNNNNNQLFLYQAASALVEESVKQWKIQEEVIDDITCVILQFNVQQNNNKA